MILQTWLQHEQVSKGKCEKWKTYFAVRWVM